MVPNQVLGRGILKANQAVDAAPEGYPNLAACLNNPDNMFRGRFKWTRKMEDLGRSHP
jgi:hypothetical protein